MGESEERSDTALSFRNCGMLPQHFAIFKLNFLVQLTDTKGEKILVEINNTAASWFGEENALTSFLCERQHQPLWNADTRCGWPPEQLVSAMGVSRSLEPAFGTWFYCLTSEPFSKVGRLSRNQSASRNRRLAFPAARVFDLPSYQGTGMWPRLCQSCQVEFFFFLWGRCKLSFMPAHFCSLPWTRTEAHG